MLDVTFHDFSILLGVGDRGRWVWWGPWLAWASLVSCGPSCHLAQWSWRRCGWFRRFFFEDLDLPSGWFVCLVFPMGNSVLGESIGNTFYFLVVPQAMPSITPIIRPEEDILEKYASDPVSFYPKEFMRWPASFLFYLLGVCSILPFFPHPSIGLDDDSAWPLSSWWHGLNLRKLASAAGQDTPFRAWKSTHVFNFWNKKSEQHFSWFSNHNRKMYKTLMKPSKPINPRPTCPQPSAAKASLLLPEPSACLLRQRRDLRLAALPAMMDWTMKNHGF